MDIFTIYLARVWGAYFLIASVMVFMNRRALMLSVKSMFTERFAELVAAMIAILGGLAYVNLYQNWSSFPAGLLSLLGWLVLIKGLLYAFLPQAKLAKLTGLLTERMWYTADGVLALLAGLYLAGYGYGLW